MSSKLARNLIRPAETKLEHETKDHNKLITTVNNQQRRVEGMLFNFAEHFAIHSFFAISFLINATLIVAHHPTHDRKLTSPNPLEATRVDK